MTKMKSFIKYF